MPSMGSSRLSGVLRTRMTKIIEFYQGRQTISKGLLSAAAKSIPEPSSTPFKVSNREKNGESNSTSTGLCVKNKVNQFSFHLHRFSRGYSSETAQAIKAIMDKEEVDMPVEFLENVVTSAQESFGSHKFTATVFLRLAQAYHKEGHPGEKIMGAVQKAWEWFDKNSEKDDLVRVMCLHLMASASTRLGKPEAALQYLQSSLAVPDSSQTEGEHAMMTFTTHMLLGDTWTILSGQHEAQLAYRKALELQEKALGPADQRVGDTCRYLAESLAQMMRFDEALPLAKRALDIHLKSGMEGSVGEAIDRRLLAAIHTGLEDPHSALHHLEASRSLLLHRRDGLDAAMTDVAIGDMLVALGKPQEALGSFQEALNVQEKVLGKEHPTVAATYASMADAFLKSGDARLAEDYCEKAMAIYANGTGDDPMEAANGMSELAHIYEALENAPTAVELHKKSLELRSKIPSQQLAVAGIESNLGILYMSLDQNDEAFKTLKSSFTKLEAVYGDGHPSVATALYYLAVAIMKVDGQSKQEEALKLLRKAKSILESTGVDGNVEYVDIFEGLVPLLVDTGRLEEARQCQLKVVDVREKALGQRHPLALQARQALKQLEEKKQ